MMGDLVQDAQTAMYDIKTGVTDLFEDAKYDPETKKPLNRAAYEDEIAAAVDAGDDEYADRLMDEMAALPEEKDSSIKDKAAKLSDIGKVLDVSGDQKVLKGRQIEAPTNFGPSRARGFGDIARLPYRYDVAGEGSYQQSGALEDLVSQGIKGLLSNAIRQNPYRRLI